MLNEPRPARLLQGALLAVAVAGLAWPVKSQPVPINPPIEMEVSAAIGAPGSVVVIPLVLHIRDTEARLSAAEVELKLPSSAVELKAVRWGERDPREEARDEPRESQPSQDGPVSYTATETGEDGLTVLIRIAGTPSIEAGELARVVLAIRPTAVEQSYILPVEARVWANGAQPESIESLDGILVISSTAPVFGCFFYMH